MTTDNETPISSDSESETNKGCENSQSSSDHDSPSCSDSEHEGDDIGNDSDEVSSDKTDVDEGSNIVGRFVKPPPKRGLCISCLVL